MSKRDKKRVREQMETQFRIACDQRISSMIRRGDEHGSVEFDTAIIKCAYSCLTALKSIEGVVWAVIADGEVRIRMDHKPAEQKECPFRNAEMLKFLVNIHAPKLRVEGDYPCVGITGYLNSDCECAACRRNRKESRDKLFNSSIYGSGKPKETRTPWGFGDFASIKRVRFAGDSGEGNFVSFAIIGATLDAPDVCMIELCDSLTGSSMNVTPEILAEHFEFMNRAAVWKPCTKEALAKRTRCMNAEAFGQAECASCELFSDCRKYRYG